MRTTYPSWKLQKTSPKRTLRPINSTKLRRASGKYRTKYVQKRYICQRTMETFQKFCRNFQMFHSQRLKSKPLGFAAHPVQLTHFYPISHTPTTEKPGPTNPYPTRSSRFPRSNLLIQLFSPDPTPSLPRFFTPTQTPLSCYAYHSQKVRGKRFFSKNSRKSKNSFKEKVAPSPHTIPS